MSTRTNSGSTKSTPPPTSVSRIDPRADVLARTIYGEARGETGKGKEAVAAVIMNRQRRARDAGGTYWWGSTVEEICRRPWQFSCWNADDPNLSKLESVKPGNKTFLACLKIARAALAGNLKDPTDGATHYHTKSVSPPWAKGRTPSAEIGGHLFYNDVD